MPPMCGQQFEFIRWQRVNTLDAVTVPFTIKDVPQNLNLQITGAR